jgi:hypothetical protein
VEQLLLDHGMEHIANQGVEQLSFDRVEQVSSKGVEQCIQSRGGADLQVCGKGQLHLGFSR